MDRVGLLEEDHDHQQHENGLNHSDIGSNTGNKEDQERAGNPSEKVIKNLQGFNNEKKNEKVEEFDEYRDDINLQKYQILRQCNTMIDIYYLVGEHIRDEDDVDTTNYPKEVQNATPHTKRKMIEEIQIKKIKKLTPIGTYFSLLKGFVCTGILYLPKNFRNGGWLWALLSMVLSFVLTLYCAIKLLQAKAKTENGSFSDIGFKAIGKPGKIMVDIFLSLSQIGFVTAYIYFITTSLKSVYDEAKGDGSDVSVIWFVRKIEKFAWTHLVADGLILLTTIVILIYALLQLSKHGWGENNEIFNTSTWLTMIGSSVYSYEGIGVILPLLEVTEKPELYPKILFYVLLTVMLLYVGFGEFCLFVYGDLISNPLITANLPSGVIVWIIKVCFSINLFFTYPLQIYPANIIIESYLYGKMDKSKKRQWLKNLSRSILILFTIVFCISLGDTVDKFISLLGSLTCTPISFTLPCIFHLKLCNPSQKEKYIDYFIIGLSLLIMFFCSGYTIWHWKD
ncbi:UNKNOWN [Stylonychia lemnae]|uniref:Amino acid transporter transmembrane domain-containing protein n=1 Tax=Stylonychia lemnae TaxID=5949 RepID=A0A078BB26_STYLE|nr:UNKNOWN [Stylonychia lemnae]|eukprot:CDW90768.1 UNKNOWN [Stylonychia lemnae]